MLKVFLMMIVASILFSSCRDQHIIVKTIRNGTRLILDDYDKKYKVNDTLLLEQDINGYWRPYYDDDVVQDTIIWYSKDKTRSVFRKAIVVDTY